MVVSFCFSPKCTLDNKLLVWLEKLLHAEALCTRAERISEGE